MAYKDILIHIDESNECQERTRAAIALAKSHEAHLVGLSPAIQFILPAHVEAFMIRGVMQQHEEDAQKMAQSAKDQFERAMSDLDVSSECHVESCLEPELTTLISSYARTSDLVVLSQPKDEDMPFGGRRVSEEVALASGRPVMLIPYIGFGKSIGNKVLIAWDGSREAARAVNDALPILVSAESVVILSVGQGKDGASNADQPGAEIARHLARHGCTVEVEQIRALDAGVGDTVLSRCADLGTDLLVMGAYGHARLKEMILGGVTRHVLNHMTVPTLLSH